MSTANAIPFPLEAVPRGRYVYELEAQARDFVSDRPDRLTLSCSEHAPGRVPGWRRHLGASLQLRSPGARLDAAGLREAIHYATRELGVRDLVVVLHARCSELVPEGGPAAAERERALPFLERVTAARVRAREQLAAARDEVRGRVQALENDPELAGTRIRGWVYVEESGVVLELDAATGEFGARP